MSYSNVVRVQEIIPNSGVGEGRGKGAGDMTVEVGFTTNFGERCKEGKKPDVISVEWMQE